MLSFCRVKKNYIKTHCFCCLKQEKIKEQKTFLDRDTLNKCIKSTAKEYAGPNNEKNN